MPLSPDAITAKFADLQDLRIAINEARQYLVDNREGWMRYVNGPMVDSWADEAGMENQIRNAKFSDFGKSNEEFLDRLAGAVDQAENELRGAVIRARNAIAGA